MHPSIVRRKRALAIDRRQVRGLIAPVNFSCSARRGSLNLPPSNWYRLINGPHRLSYMTHR